MRASILAFGANRREMTARLAATVSNISHGLRPDWDSAGAPNATIKLACSRTFGPFGYVLVHVEGRDAYVQLLLDQQKALETAIVRYCRLSRTDREEMKVIAVPSALLESERTGQDRFEFQFEAEESGFLAGEVAAACLKCGANIVAYDGILRPIISPYAMPNPRYRQHVTCYVDRRLRGELTTSEFESALSEARHRHATPAPASQQQGDLGSLSFGRRRYGETLDPEVFDIRFNGFHNGPYVYLTMVGPDNIGMVAAGASYLLRQQAVVNASVHQRNLARRGIIRCHSRSMGGLGVVMMCAAWPASIEPGSCVSDLERFLSQDQAMRSLRDRGVETTFVSSSISPWPSSQSDSKLILQAESSDRRGELARFCEVLRNSTFAREYDIAEFDGRLDDYRAVDRPDRLRFVAGLILDPRANEVDAKRELHTILSNAGYAVSFRLIGTDIADASWDLAVG